MTISAHQPQYVPWLGYFDKIDRSNFFIFLDQVQYKKREFQNRNKIKNQNCTIWLTVPVLTKGKYHQKICDVELDYSRNWQRKHWKTIETNYRSAPHFPEYQEEIFSLYSENWNSLARLNRRSVEILMKLLGISTPIISESELKIDGTGNDRIIQICQKVGAKTYLSGSGGKNYLDRNAFEDANIKLKFQNFTHPIYPQLGTTSKDYIPNLSAIDLIFNCGDRSLEIIRGKL